MFKEYSLKDWFIYIIIDIPFFLMGCWAISDYIGIPMSGILFLLLCILSTIKYFMEVQHNQIKSIKTELDDVKKELITYKEQVLEG